MLDEEYKKGMLDYIKNISPQELERTLISIGSTKPKNNKYNKDKEDK